MQAIEIQLRNCIGIDHRQEFNWFLTIKTTSANLSGLYCSLKLV